VSVIRVPIAAFQIKGRAVFYFYFKVTDGRRVVPEFFKTGIDSAAKFRAIKNGNIESGFVEPVNVVPGDPFAGALLSGHSQGGVLGQLFKQGYQLFFPADVGAFNGAIGDVAGSLQGIDPHQGKILIASAGVYFSLQADMCFHCLSSLAGWPIGIGGGEIGIGIGEPQLTQDDQDRIGGIGMDKIAVEIAGKLLGGRTGERELPVELVAVHGKIAMDADPGGVGTFVDHHKMAEGSEGVGGWRRDGVMRIVQPDGQLPKGQQVRVG
jgi:hypothetical protein